MNTAEYLLENARPGDVAIIDQGNQRTYRDLARAVDAIALKLRALELPAGASVGILGPNSFFWVAGYVAVLKCGLVAVPFSVTLGPAEVERNARIGRCVAAVMDRSLAPRLADSFGGSSHVVTDEVLDGAAAPAAPFAVVDPGADATLMFTSGTTAEPKAVRLTHRNIRANTDSIIDYLALDRCERMLVVLPFSYVFGASLLHTHLRVGGSLAI